MSLLVQAKNVISELLTIRELKAKTFAAWNPELEDALGRLPEKTIFPHSMFRNLWEAAAPHERQLILVTRQGEPIAVAGLKRRWGRWEPLTQWIVPGVLFPVKEECIPEVLAVLGLNIHVGWWRWNTPPPSASWIRNAVSSPTYGIQCAEFERYWRERGFFKNINKYRNRCRGFSTAVNSAGAREWTIRNWGTRWLKPGMPEMPDLQERLLVSEYLEKQGLFYTLTIQDGDRTAAGITFLIDGNTAVAQVNYRDPAYDWHGVMTRLMDHSFYWARDMGYERIDLGGSFDYKEKWAPESGVKWEFDVAPRYVRLMEKVSFSRAASV